MGIPVVISTNGFGVPVRAVDSGAPLMKVAANGFGLPIVLSDLGAPFVVEGAVDPGDDPFSATGGNGQMTIYRMPAPAVMKAQGGLNALTIIGE